MQKNKNWIVFALMVAGLSCLCAAAWYYRAALFLSGAAPVSDAESDVPVAAASWPASNLDWQTVPVDLSFLNAGEKPAGRRGFVRASGESLVFADGTPARFWGTNLAANALYGTSGENVRRQARRISALGFNLVRIHHQDTFWVNPNIFGKNAADTQTLDTASLKKLDWWIKCLKDEGIYIWLDLHVERALTAGDHIYGFDEIRKGNKAVELKGYNYVNQSMQQAMKQFNAAYLSHVNAYTGLAYRNEPAIMALLITNENDITNHFGNMLSSKDKVPLHYEWYASAATDFATRNNLSPAKTLRSWEPGPSKLFLNDLEHRFNTEMITHLRGLGIKVPIVTTSMWGDNSISSLPALAGGDMIDVHAYGGIGELEKNPLAESSMVNWISMGQVAGMPMSVTEWNVSPFPVADRHSSPLYMASAARLQGWDAVMLFAYATAPLNDAGQPTNWRALNDPALIATLPAAALLYRQEHVKEADTIYALTPDREQLFYQANSASNSAAARTASERGKLVLVMPEIQELSWLKRGQVSSNARVISNLQQSTMAEEAVEVASDSGEIRRNWKRGIYTINTSRTQAAMGKIGNEQIVLPDVKMEIKTPNASVVVQSMDQEPISASTRLMISLGARAVPTVKSLPFRAEPVEGQLTIRASKGLRLIKQIPGEKERVLPAIYADGKYVINLEAGLDTSWLFLK